MSRARVGGAEALALLGRHVAGRAALEPGAGLDAGGLGFAGEPGEAEVEHLDALAADHLGIGDQEQVLGFEIAVDDAGGVRGLQHVGDLAAEPAALEEIEAPLLEARCEGDALELLRHHVRAPLGRHAVVEDVHDAGVADGRGGLRLVEEALHHLGVARELRQEHLHDHAAAERVVAAGVDRARAALADQPLDAVVAELFVGHLSPPVARGPVAARPRTPSLPQSRPGLCGGQAIERAAEAGALVSGDERWSASDGEIEPPTSAFIE